MLFSKIPQHISQTLRRREELPWVRLDLWIAAVCCLFVLSSQWQWQRWPQLVAQNAASLVKRLNRL
jgi:cell division FtsZ-interacting protein ZapD